MSAATTDPAVLGALTALHVAVVQVFRVHRVPMPKTVYRRTLADDVLDALLAGPAPARAKELARRMGKRPHSHFRDCLAQLAQEGKIAHGPGGYRPVPPPQ